MPPHYDGKNVSSPLTAGIHQLHLRTQGSASSSRWKKCFLPLTAGTHQLHLRMQGRASLLHAKKFFLLTAGTHQLHLRTQGSASLLCAKIMTIPKCWDPQATSSHARMSLINPLAVGTH